MALYQDIVDGIIAEVDTTALDIIIQNYIDEPSNGFFNSEEVEYLGEDGTDVNYTYLYTIPNTTVQGWKDQGYLETAYNNASLQQGEIVITDENSPQYPIPDFESLVDSVFDSGGLSFDTTSWVQYDLLTVQHVDVVSVWCSNSTSQVYFGYSANGDDWTYLKAEGDHTLDSNGRLIEATDESDAQTNYWTIDGIPGEHNQAKFPLAVRARYVKMFTLTLTDVYQLAYRYYIIPAQLVIDYLSALTADVGLLTAGVIQSANFDDGGTKLDLDNDVFTVYDDQGNLRVKLGKLT